MRMIPNIQAQQFLTIVRCKNLSRAAEELYMSQPALSLSLSKLEKELGLLLFYRDRNRLILTPAGEQLLPLFTEINDANNRLMLKVDALKSVPERSISVGFSGSVRQFATFYMTDFLTSFRERPIELLLADGGQVLKMLLDGIIDFSITYPPIQNENISSIPLLREKIVLAVSANHPLAMREQLSLKEISRYPLTALKKPHSLRKFTEEIHYKKGIPFNCTRDFNYPEYSRIVEEDEFSDRFAAFVPITMRPFYGANYRFIPLEEKDVERITTLSWVEDQKKQYEYKEFIEHLQEGYQKQHDYYVNYLRQTRALF